MTSRRVHWHLQNHIHARNAHDIYIQIKPTRHTWQWKRQNLPYIDIHACASSPMPHQTSLNQDSRTGQVFKGLELSSSVHITFYELISLDCRWLSTAESSVSYSLLKTVAQTQAGGSSTVRAIADVNPLPVYLLSDCNSSSPSGLWCFSPYRSFSY